MNRREFIRNSAQRAAAVAAPVAAVTLAGGGDLYDRLSGQIGKAAESLHTGLRGLSERVDSLEFKYRLVMALLVISMLVDGGMTWFLFNVPAPLVA
ncbi:MAG: hypothetical protein DWQ08_10620 [Proteobacteria bacterium]|nr:MAG: hypothetical protein DWQ08_10620 [Pseudomonadota bacterium]